MSVPVCMSVMCFRIFKRGEKERDVLPTQCTLDLRMYVCVCVRVFEYARIHQERERDREREKRRKHTIIIISSTHKLEKFVLS